MKPEVTAQLVIGALLMAVRRRALPKELLRHSYQANQCTSEYLKLLLGVNALL